MKIDFPSEFFSPRDTLFCGQTFRFFERGDKLLVLSGDKACFLYSSGDKTIVECDDGDYFYNYFDLANDYGKIYDKAISFNIPFLTCAAQKGKGIRLLNQNREEMIFSFIISQNNNIPRIKRIIEKICFSLGEKKQFCGEEYFCFPSALKLSEAGKDFFKSVGAGYRDSYLYETAKKISEEGISHLDSLKGEELKRALMRYKGVGGKVADCAALFGFKDTSRFPVDTWLEKVYIEDFHGREKSRGKMTEYFESLFGEYSGYIQQYMFHAKRNGEKS